MIPECLVTAIVLLLGCIFVYFGRSQARKLPNYSREAPLAKGWPILGILPIIIKPLCHFLMHLGKIHGSLFRIRFGMRDIFVLNSHSIFKKCLKEDGDNFSGRWRGKVNDFEGKNSGILMIDGEVWAKQRSFVLKVFRDFGLGKSRTIEIVQDECHHLLKEIERSKNTSVNFAEIIPVYAANIILAFIMRKRYEREDKDFRLIEKFVEDRIKREDKLMTFLFLFPTWDQSTFLSTLSYYLSSRKASLNRVYDIFRKEIHNHLKVIDLNCEGEDLIDRFWIERSKLISKTGSEMEFSEFQLIRSSLELFIAGYDTVSTTLCWSLLFISRHPNIQERMHEEIISLIGSDQLPSINDKKSLPLIQAVMDEILRMSTVVPLSIVHRNLRDTVIDGIFIPGDSLIFPNIYACHRDPQVWQKPFEFYPGHFMTKGDDGVLRYTPREELIPFGLGRRQCIGELLARAEYYIFLASIIQRYKVRFARNVSENDYQEAIRGGDGITRYSKIQDFTFERYE